MRTRTQAEIEARERRVLRIFAAKGARLIEAHGSLVGFNRRPLETVPRNTVIVFLSNFGQCMYIEAGRTVANQFFHSNENIRNFLKGAGGRTGLLHGNVTQRTFLPGEHYPNASLTFSNDKLKGYGYVWPLPLARNRMIGGQNLEREHAPSRSEINTRIPYGITMSLSETVQTLGPGVYIVNACLPPVNQLNLGNDMPVIGPHYNTEGYMPSIQPRRTVGFRRFQSAMRSVRRPGPKAGTVRRTVVPPAPRFPRTRTYKYSTNDILRILGRKPNTNLNSLFQNTRANANLERLRQTQRILVNPNTFVNGLARIQQTRWRLQPRTWRPFFVYERV